MTIKKSDMPIKNFKKPNKKTVKYLIYGSITVVAVLMFLFFQLVFEKLPSLEELENPTSSLASNIYSRDGVIIGQFFKENRVEVSIDSIPQHVVNALIATEDKNFYNHWGVDLQRFFKAMVKNILFFKREGASTITQQLAKNIYKLKFKRESSFDTALRKIREWITAIQLEKNYTKREILEMYFNSSSFGKGAYGINMAARTFFDKKVQDLTVPEAAVLIAMLKANFYYDPFERYDNSFNRRNLVMLNMVNEDFLTEEAYENFKKEPIKLSYKKIVQGIHGSIAPHFQEYIRQQMNKLADKHGFDLYEGGLNIYTTLDSKMQEIANNAVKVHLEEYQKQFDNYWNWNRNPDLLNDAISKSIREHPSYKRASNESEKNEARRKLLANAAFIDSVKTMGKRIEVGFVAIDSKTGEIRAMVGGRDTKFLYGLNHVTQIKRQPGSAFKPFVYLTAIDNGLYPAYPILNKRFEYPDGTGKYWSPQNFDYKQSGYMTLRHALALSINIVAGRLIVEGHAPIDKMLQFASRMGIKSKLDPYPALALGVSGVTPLEITSAYATMANRGVYNEPIAILRIEDKDGGLIEKFTTYSSEAIPEETNYIVTDMLKTAINNGTGAAARSVYNFQRPAAGKTGTTQEFSDAWYVGFTPQLTAGVWVGFDDHRIKFNGSNGQGGRAALPIWAIFMHDVYAQMNLPVEDFIAPTSGDVVPVTFCKESIYQLGVPRLYSSDCHTGELTDIINVKDIPQPYDPLRDTQPKANPFPEVDTTSRVAKEITRREHRN